MNRLTDEDRAKMRQVVTDEVADRARRKARATSGWVIGPVTELPSLERVARGSIGCPSIWDLTDDELDEIERIVAEVEHPHAGKAFV